MELPGIPGDSYASCWDPSEILTRAIGNFPGQEYLFRYRVQVWIEGIGSFDCDLAEYALRGTSHQCHDSPLNETYKDYSTIPLNLAHYYYGMPNYGIDVRYLYA